MGGGGGWSGERELDRIEELGEGGVMERERGRWREGDGPGVTDCVCYRSGRVPPC